MELADPRPLTPGPLIAAREKRLGGNIPLGRFSRFEEIASMLAFLASSGASYVTVGVFLVDDGWTAV